MNVALWFRCRLWHNVYFYIVNETNRPNTGKQRIFSADEIIQREGYFVIFIGIHYVISMVLLLQSMIFYTSIFLGSVAQFCGYSEYLSIYKACFS